MFTITNAIILYLVIHGVSMLVLMGHGLFGALMSIRGDDDDADGGRLEPAEPKVPDGLLPSGGGFSWPVDRVATDEEVRAISLQRKRETVAV
jgi:hypothetical protein